MAYHVIIGTPLPSVYGAMKDRYRRECKGAIHD
jgi:hypothetical protein